MTTRYTDKQLDTLLNEYFREGARARPYPAIAVAMGVSNPKALDDLVWKIVTGYAGNNAAGPRRVYVATANRRSRAGAAWTKRDDDALRAALTGEGQQRKPPCDLAYIADVLARPVEEVDAHWKQISGDPLGRPGFGLA